MCNDIFKPLHHIIDIIETLREYDAIFIARSILKEAPYKNVEERIYMFEAIAGEIINA
jgi:hypothetical protein